MAATLGPFESLGIGCKPAIAQYTNATPCFKVMYEKLSILVYVFDQTNFLVISRFLVAGRLCSISLPRVQD